MSEVAPESAGIFPLAGASSSVFVSIQRNNYCYRNILFVRKMDERINELKCWYINIMNGIDEQSLRDLNLLFYDSKCTNDTPQANQTIRTRHPRSYQELATG